VDIGQRLLSYPHFIETIHSFVNRFLATPWLLSKGYRILAIDNEITNRVRRNYLGEKNYHRLKGYLEKKHKSFDGLRITSANFATPLAGGSFPDGAHTDIYKLASSALQYSAEQGYFCFDEIFVLGQALLEEQPDLPSILSQRFPFILIDEMQDTSEQQSVFLRRIFARNSDAVCVQRVGDPNQSIFEGGSKPPTTDGFPDPDENRCLSIASSFRFDSTIASLASPFAFMPVQPTGLQGVRVGSSLAPISPHTIFVFPDNDASMVLDAFGRHVVTSLPNMLNDTSAVTAIGAVHKPAEEVTPGHAQYPKTVAHYWEGYQSVSAKKAHHPNTLAEYILSAQSIVRGGGQLHQCVNNVAFGFVHLANLLPGSSQIKALARIHRLVEDKLNSNVEAKLLYRNILTRYVVGNETLTYDLWIELRPKLKTLAAVLGGGDPNAASADSFLFWPKLPFLMSSQTVEATNSVAPNTYRFSEGGTSVDIRLSTIHAAKGQTHLATLILETFMRTHFLKNLMPWLLGKHHGGTECKNDESALRLYQAYVAMTRPTHLLCIAVRDSSLGEGKKRLQNQAKLIERGWKIKHLTSAAMVEEE
jgi:hypothetical protein